MFPTFAKSSSVTTVTLSGENIPTEPLQDLQCDIKVLNTDGEEVCRRMKGRIVNGQILVDIGKVEVVGSVHFEVCMCVCMYVCIYLCMYVCVYILTCVCVYACMYVYIMYVCVYIYMHTHTHGPGRGLRQYERTHSKWSNFDRYRKSGGGGECPF